ncbi:hypothetical protein A3K64_02275 [Candidatus Micrarchaeota archaeon RBG_16_36_9]|nr:MAG: hypothetical protein A3K64_02275 [Candidatus Micrarchaeota archaeon RBG_16_36_9]
MKKYYKPEKNPLFAGILNFLFWGLGYLYLEKRTDEAFYLIFSCFLVWIFSFWYLSVSGPLAFAGIFWIILWYMWVSLYTGYDAYRITKVRK